MIRVNENWIINVDSLNYMPCRDLHRKKALKTNDGTVVEVDDYSNPIGFYTTLSSALSAIMQSNFRDAVKDDEISLKDALKIIEEENFKTQQFLNSCDVKAEIK